MLDSGLGLKKSNQTLNVLNFFDAIKKSRLAKPISKP
jgi:hypothetical protein